MTQLEEFYRVHADELAEQDPHPLEGRGELPPEIVLVDDDGVLVAASGRALAARWAQGGFDYDFPKAIVEGMRARELVAWSVNMEGEHALRVRVAERAEADEILSSLSTVWTPKPPILVEVREDDALWLLPYSQYTSACDGEKGRLQVRDGLAARVELPAGRYDVHVIEGNVRVFDGYEKGFDFLLLAVPGARLRENDPAGLLDV